LKNVKKLLSYILVIVFSALFIFVGYKITMKKANIFTGEQEGYQAKVIEVLDEQNDTYDFGGETVTERYLNLKAKIINGDKKGEIIELKQTLEGLYDVNTPPAKVSDILMVYPSEEDESSWVAGDYVRFGKIKVLIVIFVLLVILFGKKKGLNTILSLAFTCLSIFLVFVPSILAGYNIYYSSVIICIYIVIMTLSLVSGFNMKSLSAGLGCISGVMVAGLIGVIMQKSMKLTGLVDDDSMFLLMMNPDNPIDLKAIIFAAIIIGALGATMDVAMSISSSLKEISDELKDVSFKKLFKSGITIGRDIMGTMANTLILAYIGGSLSIVLLLITYNSSLTEILNREMIIVELLQSLAGSLGILFTIPFTTIISAYLYSHFEIEEVIED